MKNPYITIIDYGIGNTHSVLNALKYLGYSKIKISDNYKDILESDALILPGVGAFEACFKNLKNRGLIPILNDEVLVKKKPILGICVGMQLLATHSEENGLHNGLDWIKGKVKKLETPKNLPVPHVGWNNANINFDNPLIKNNENKSFYFDHSYHFECDSKYVFADSDYGLRVTAGIQKDNIFGVQFHPEKSQVAGLKLFRGFLKNI
ncbi:imidazole glycerol phosphate synthase subunit HisH [Akkermansiaceae bacterium]|nr:imidazole glycerol phosphate synthase subunit HisH [Akkermansiaceae bacterium]